MEKEIAIKNPKEMVEFFREQGIKVHVGLHNRRFLNGLILDEIKPGVYAFLDCLVGETFIFLDEIFNIHKYEERK